MIVPCIKGGLVVDASKCAPLDDHDLVMYITTKLSLEFYDIYDCKTQTQFSISNMILNGLKVKQDIYDKRIIFFNKHKKALISRTVSDEDQTVFFDSIEIEAIEKTLQKNKFSAKVRIIFDGKEVTLKELKQKSKKDFNNVVFFIREMNMVEMISVEDYEEVVNKVKFPHKAKLKDIGFGFAVGIAISFLACKIMRRR